MINREGTLKKDITMKYEKKNQKCKLFFLMFAALSPVD